MNEDELIREVYFANKKEIDQRASESRFSKTISVLFRFFLKVEELSKSLALLEKSGFFYSSQGLARIADEHYLVAYYIWVKARVDNNDDCANDYLVYYPVFEFIKQQNYNSRLDKSYDSKLTPLQNFLKRNSSFEKLIAEGPIGEDDITDVNRRSNQFDIRRILKYLQDDLDQNDAVKSFQTKIHDICIKYNKRSSFVHGGRLADSITFEKMSDAEKETVLQGNTSFGEMFSSQILNQIMILLIIDKNDFFLIFKPIWDSMKVKHNLDFPF